MTWMLACLSWSTLFLLTIAKILDRVSRLPSQSCNFRTLHFFTGQFLTTVVLLASSSKYFLEIVSVQYGLHGCVFSLSFGLFQV